MYIFAGSFITQLHIYCYDQTYEVFSVGSSPFLLFPVEPWMQRPPPQQRSWKGTFLLKNRAKNPPGAHQVQWVADQLRLDCKVKSSFELYPTKPAATDQVKPSVEFPEELVEPSIWSVALPVDARDDPHHQDLHVLRQEGHQLALDEVILWARCHHQPQKGSPFESQPAGDNDEKDRSDDEVEHECILEHALHQLHAARKRQPRKLRGGSPDPLGKLGVAIPSDGDFAIDLHHFTDA